MRKGKRSKRGVRRASRASRSRVRRRSPRPTSKAKRHRVKSHIKTRGYGSKIRVRSKALRQDLTINRKTTKLTRGVKPTSKAMGTLRGRLTEIAEKHRTKIGKSRDSLYYIRLTYNAKVNGKKIESGFSIPITKIRNKKQLAEAMELLLDNFQSSIKGYLQRGFTGISVTGITVQGYT